MRFFVFAVVGCTFAVFHGVSGNAQICQALGAYGGALGGYAAKAGDSLATTLSRFVPDSWLAAYAAIPPTTRQCLIRYKMSTQLPKFLMSQPQDPKQVQAEQQGQCAQGYDKVIALQQTVFADVGRLTPTVQKIFGDFAKSLFQGGIGAFQSASANYQAAWLTAQPADQAKMQEVFPKLGFFFNGPYSIPLTQQALKLAQGDYSVLPQFLTTVMGISQLAASQAPAPNQAPFAPVHTALQQDLGYMAQMAGQTAQQMCAGGGGAAQSPQCVDQAGNCAQLASYCTNAIYRSTMEQNCKKTCGVCGGASAPVASTCVDAHPSCPQWQQQGACQSTRFTPEVKRQYCAKTCGFC